MSAAVERDAARGRRNQPHDGLDGRGLADAVAAEHGRDAACGQLEIDPLEDVAGAIVRVEVLGC